MVRCSGFVVKNTHCVSPQAIGCGALKGPLGCGDFVFYPVAVHVFFHERCQMTPKELYIVDGHALAYRSYFGMMRTPMSNAQGMPTGALFAFANSLLNMINTYKCPYLTVVFDSPKPTFRHELYANYKATRQAMPEDMVVQLPFIHQLVANLNIPTIMRDGLEADDIIAWLTRKAEAEGFKVFLLTRDKDLMQLLSDNVRMLSPETGGKIVEMGPAEVEAKMGVQPHLVRDLLALMGDASDNVPGVPGVGPKTAVKILLAAGSIDALLSDFSLAGNDKLAQKLAEHRADIELSRQLVTLHTDIHFDVELEQLQIRDVNKSACVEMFTQMEFSTLLRNPLFDTRQQLAFSAHIVQSLEQVRTLVDSINQAGFCSIDTETTSIVARDARLVGIAVAVDKTTAWYLPLGHTAQEQPSLPLEPVLELMRPLLENASIAKIGQNLKYDYQVFKNYAITLRGIRFDTMVAAYLLEPGKRQYNLDALAAEWLQLTTTPIEALIGKGKGQISFAEVPVELAAPYAGEDVLVPILLQELLEPQLREKNLYELFERMELPLISVLAEMEWQGVMVDEQLLAQLSSAYQGQLQEITSSIYAMAGEEFNLNSPKQIAEMFFGKLGLPHSKKTKTGLSTDVTALEKLAPRYPIAARLLEHREVQKLLSTYIDALPAQVLRCSGRLHSSFNQTITATGRLSSTAPNLQNIPIRTEAGARIREAFIAPAGSVLVAADYSQIELRLLAHLSGDALLRQAFEQDQDIHAQTAAVMYGCFPQMVTPEMRRAAKTINFGLMYGMGPVNLAGQLGISFREAQNFIDIYFAQFPSIKKFMERVVDEARTRGYSETMFGRRRYLPDIDSPRRQLREGAERIAVNTPVQGSAADIIKIAMVNIHQEIAQRFPAAHLLLQVHDELVFEVPEQQAEGLRDWVVQKMSQAASLTVALKVDAGIGTNWRQAH
jgi:DNA polymerase-1